MLRGVLGDGRGGIIEHMVLWLYEGEVLGRIRGVPIGGREGSLATAKVARLCGGTKE